MFQLHTILGEEVSLSKLTLFDITKRICDAVQARAEQGMEIMNLSETVTNDSLYVKYLYH